MAKKPKPWSVGRVRVRPLTPPRKDGKYRCRLEWYPSSDGKMATRSLGWASRDEAETAAASVITEGLPTPSPSVRQGLAELRTVEDLMSAWLYVIENDRPDLSPMSIKRYRDATRALLGTKESPRLRYHTLDTLTRENIQRWVSLRQRQGVAGSSIEVQLIMIGAAWRWAVDLGYLAGPPPTKAIKYKQVRVYNDRTPTALEVQQTLTGMRTEWHGIAVQLLWSTGARVGEIATLTWEAINLGSGWMTLHGAEDGTRTGKGEPREIPIFPQCREALERLQPDPAERVGLLFPFEATSVSRRIYLAIKNACDRAEVPRWTPHGLRRLAVDDMCRAGIDIATAAAITGHSIEVMLRHYRTVSRSDKREAMARARLGQAPAGTLIQLPKKG